MNCKRSQFNRPLLSTFWLLRSCPWRAGVAPLGPAKAHCKSSSHFSTGPPARDSMGQWSSCRPAEWVTATPSHTHTAGPLMPRAPLSQRGFCRTRRPVNVPLHNTSASPLSRAWPVWISRRAFAGAPECRAWARRGRRIAVRRALSSSVSRPGEPREGRCAYRPPARVSGRLSARVRLREPVSKAR